ncbi:single-stranded DNA-binding protein [Lacticaseibacillus paracasei]|uniref:single-stranded DNA-binding protein n=1 Tax=Lacticaseibacillus paracasei TaxID=1597 RepID=UPI0021A73CE4|nr:single-stranded DNA-binding protein [Lacticaseibacillus paracasei]MCT4383808.1 single-stranded DNA-binding protein [Lacticaseibacillus paracasei]
MNNFSGIGRIATDAKVGNGVLSSLLAIKRIYKSNDNQTADFIPITLFQRQAENFNRLTSKGDKIGIDGSIKTSKYADENGEVHYGWAVTVNHFYLISSKPHNGASPKLSDATLNILNSQLVSASKQAKVSDDELPF